MGSQFGVLLLFLITRLSLLNIRLRIKKAKCYWNLNILTIICWFVAINTFDTTNLDLCEVIKVTFCRFSFELNHSKY